MGNKKRRFNTRFPPARIKKIMQKDEEIGKIAAPVPPVISRGLELFLEELVLKSVDVATNGSSKTVTTSHIKKVIENHERFDFLKSLVKLVPELPADGSDPAPQPRPPKEKKAKQKQPINAEMETEDSQSSNSKELQPSTSTAETYQPYKRKRGRPPLAKNLNGKSETVDEQPAADNSAPNPLWKPNPVVKQPSLTHSSIFNTTSTVLHSKSTLSPAHSNKITELNNEPYVAPTYTDLSPTSMPIDLTTRSSNNSTPEQFSLTKAVNSIHNDDDYDT